jgi:hypothetical protein
VTPRRPLDDDEQPTMECPWCGKEFPDFDGFGVLYCGPKPDGCGYCQHASRDNGVCNFCGDDYCGGEAAGAPGRRAGE